MRACVAVKNHKTLKWNKMDFLRDVLYYTVELFTIEIYFCANAHHTAANYIYKNATPINIYDFFWKWIFFCCSPGQLNINIFSHKVGENIWRMIVDKHRTIKYTQNIPLNVYCAHTHVCMKKARVFSARALMTEKALSCCAGNKVWK